METYEELLKRYKKVTDDFDQTIKELEQPRYKKNKKCSEKYRRYSGRFR